MSSVFGLNQREGCLIWRSHSAVDGFLDRLTVLKFSRLRLLSFLPRLTCCSPLKHNIHHEVPLDFSKSNTNTSKFTVHKLKLKITCSCLSQLNTIRTVKHAYTYSDSKHTQLSLFCFKAWFRLIFLCSCFNISPTLFWPKAASNFVLVVYIM